MIPIIRSLNLTHKKSNLWNSKLYTCFQNKTDKSVVATRKGESHMPKIIYEMVITVSTEILYIKKSGVAYIIK